MDEGMGMGGGEAEVAADRRRGGSHGHKLKVFWGGGGKCTITTTKYGMGAVHSSNQMKAIPQTKPAIEPLLPSLVDCMGPSIFGPN
jgi:hypothetical protein